MGRFAGIKKWQVAQADIIRTLKERRYCTTMVDFYAMPEDWPGRVEAKSIPWQERAALVEKRVAEAIQEAMGGRFDPRFFVPYVQLHEFESLAFADVECLASVVAPLSHTPAAVLQQRFARILDEAGHPEAINDSYETCPSRRITSEVKAYRKRIYSPIVTARIGLGTLRARCDHFASWLTRLEQIGH